MSPAPTMFRLDDDVRQAMESLKERDGIPYNTQANHALREWLTAKGVMTAKKSQKK
jgi:hypothetical protein